MAARKVHHHQQRHQRKQKKPVPRASPQLFPPLVVEDVVTEIEPMRKVLSMVQEKDGAMRSAHRRNQTQQDYISQLVNRGYSDDIEIQASLAPYFETEEKVREAVKVMPTIAAKYFVRDIDHNHSVVPKAYLEDQKKRHHQNVHKKRRKLYQSQHQRPKKKKSTRIPLPIYANNSSLRQYVILSGDEKRDRKSGHKSFECYDESNPDLILLLQEKKLKKVHPRQKAYIQTLQKIKHPHIERYKDVILINKLVYTIREKFQNKWLIMNNYLSNRSQQSVLPDKILLDLLIQIAEGLKYLHQHNMIHGNLTMNHLIVGGDHRKPLIRLVDYTPVQSKNVEVGKINDLFSFSTVGNELMKGIHKIEQRYSKFYHEVIFILAGLREMKKQHKRLNYGDEVNIEQILEKLHSLYYKTTRSVHHCLQDKTLFKMNENNKRINQQWEKMLEKQKQLQKKKNKKIAPSTKQAKRATPTLPDIHSDLMVTANSSAASTACQSPSSRATTASTGSNSSSSGPSTPYWRGTAMMDQKPLTKYERQEPASNALIRISEKAVKHSPADRFCIENDVFVEHASDSVAEDYDVFNAIAKIKRVREFETEPEPPANQTEAENALFGFIEAKKSKGKVLLLKGNNRYGRRTFCQSLEQRLWRSHDSIRFPYVPISISLSTCQAPYQDVVHQYFERYLSASEIKLLRSTRLVTFCFIFDGYETIGQPKGSDQYGNSEYNLYRLNGLEAWNCRCIITDTQQHVQSLGKKYRIYFSPNSKANKLIEVELMKIMPRNGSTAGKKKKSSSFSGLKTRQHSRLERRKVKSMLKISSGVPPQQQHSKRELEKFRANTNGTSPTTTGSVRREGSSTSLLDTLDSPDYELGVLRRYDFL